MDVAQRLRNWIIDTDLAPGTPLPKQTELASRCGVSVLTVSRAMRQLQDDGLVVAIRRTGTFVAEAPPHLHTYGLLLPDAPITKHENRLILALAREATAISQQSTRKIEVYHGVMDARGSDEFSRLTDDCERRRLAGVIFGSPPFKLVGHPVLEAPGLPRVAIMSKSDKFPQIATVMYRGSTFVERAFQRLAEQGCRRVAAIVNVHEISKWESWMNRFAGEYGLEARPEWLQASTLSSPLAARQAAHLLLSHPDCRPDGVIIADDNLVEQATIGIATSGAEVQVIAHANFPWLARAAVPVQSLGFDSGLLLNHCLDAIDHQRSGRGLPAPTGIDAIFEADYRSRQSSRPAASLSALLS